MSRLFSATALATALIVLAAPASAAGMLETSVTGGLYFGTDTGLQTTNYYDPVQGYVPSGFLNSPGPGTTVFIADPAIEFGYKDDSSTISADFSDTTLTVSDSAPPGVINWLQTFTFAGYAPSVTLVESSNFEPGLSSSTVGDTLSIAWAGTQVDPDYSAIFDITLTPNSSLPEPITLSLFGAGLVGAVALRRRKRNSA